MPWSRDDLTRLVELEAHQQGVDPRLAVALAEQESGFDHTIRSPKGAYGIMQLMPGTAKQLKVNIDDPADNIRGGIQYLKQQLDAFGGDQAKAIAAYNAGPGVVQAYKGVPPYKETRGLVSRVLGTLGPSSAEAATPQAQPQAAGMSRLQELEAHLARLEGQAAPQTPPQAPGGTQPPSPVSQAAPTQATPPRPQETPQTPDTTWTPGMRFQALPSITQLEPAERTQRTQEFARLTPALQEEFLRSEEPASDLTVDIEKPSTPAPGAVSAPRTEAERQTRVREELAAWEQQAGRPWGEGDPRMPSEKRLGLPDEAPVTESLTAPSTMIPLLMPGAGAKAVAPLIAKAPAAIGRLVRPLAEGISQTLGFGTGRTAETGEVPSAGELGTTLGVTTALGGALEQAAPIVAKVGNAIRGVVKPAYQSVVDAAKKYDIRLTYGDITRGSIAPKVETGLEALPLTGGGTMRASGQKKVARAGETIHTGLQTEMQQTPWRDLASVQQAAIGTGPRAKEAQVLLAEIADAGDDWGRVIQTSGKLNLFQDRVRAEKLYDQVETLAQPLGNMRLPKATQAIDEAIARASDDVLPSPEVKREVLGALNRMKGEITPTAAQPRAAEAVFDPRTNTWRAQPTIRSTIIPDTTYSRMRRLRSSLGDLQREAAEPATARYLSGVKTALEEDMEAFARQSGVPELAKAGKNADTFYRTRIVPYREGQLAKAIEKNLPDEIYNQFVRRGKDRAQYFYNGLDPKGQAAVRYGMVEEAVNKAYSGAPDVFSPQRFATSLKKIQDAHGVFFKGTPQWEINGITKLMEHGKRFGEYMENPPTGLRGAFLGAMVGTGGLAAVPYAVKALTIGQGLRMMLMTTRGRNFLLAASDMQPGSSAFQKRLDGFLRTSPEAASLVGAARSATQEEPAGAR